MTIRVIRASKIYFPLVWGVSSPSNLSVMTFINKDDARNSLKLIELKYQFNQMIRDGFSFEELKKVHMEIKALEARINYINLKKDLN